MDSNKITETTNLSLFIDLSRFLYFLSDNKRAIVNFSQLNVNSLLVHLIERLAGKARNCTIPDFRQYATVYNCLLKRDQRKNFLLFLFHASYFRFLFPGYLFRRNGKAT